MCTYKLCGDNKRKEFGDFWEAKWGLTGMIYGDRGWQGQPGASCPVSEGLNSVVPMPSISPRAGSCTEREGEAASRLKT
jgi:hypothetical protein